MVRSLNMCTSLRFIGAAHRDGNTCISAISNTHVSQISKLINLRSTCITQFIYKQVSHEMAR